MSLKPLMFLENKLSIHFSKFAIDRCSAISLDFFSHLPPEIIKSSLLFCRPEDRIQYLIGRLLLLKGWQDFDHRNPLTLLEFDKNNRPYVPGLVDFNISHSSGLVSCIIGKNVRVGIDVEIIRKIKLSDFQPSMNEYQWEIILGSSDPVNEFFAFWTGKEAIAKADGRGLFIPFEEIHVVGDKGYCENSIWHLSRLNLDYRYYVTIASNKPVDKIEIVEDSINFQ